MTYNGTNDHRIATAPDLYTELEDAARTCEGAANTLDSWARQGREGGWSTHQVKANQEMACALWRKAASYCSALAKAHRERDHPMNTKTATNEVRVSFGAIAYHHDQPPFATPARQHVRARYVSPDTTVRELFRWAIAEPELTSLEITWEDVENLKREEPLP